MKMFKLKRCEECPFRIGKIIMHLIDFRKGDVEWIFCIKKSSDGRRIPKKYFYEGFPIWCPLETIEKNE